MKRILVILCSIVFIVSCFAVTAFAAGSDEYTVLDVDSYVYSYIFNDDGTGFASFKVPDQYCAIQTVDMYGSKYLPNGVFNGSVSSNKGEGSTISFGLYVPGGNINNTYLDISSIHTGAIIQVEFEDYFFQSSPQSYLIVEPAFRIAYFDENFQPISYQRTFAQSVIVDAGGISSGFMLSLDLVVPSSARYFNYYFTFQVTVDRGYDDSFLNFHLPNPSVELQTSYYNSIINSILQSQKPAGGESFDSLDSADVALKDQTANGRAEANNILSQGSNFLLAHTGGFLFLSNVIENFISVGWLRGILVISLSFGVFGFLANLVSSVGRSIERKSERIKDRGGGKR